MFAVVFVSSLANAAEVEEVDVLGDPRIEPSELTAISVTTISVDETQSADADVADLVDDVPGTTVQRLGGLGDWSAVSIRGSTTRQVAVLLDGIALNPEGEGAVNLSELPVGIFERIDVYRGGAPLHLSTSSIGGVVDLRTGNSPRGWVSASGGSFETWRASAGMSQPLGVAEGGSVFAAVDAFSTAGTFAYFDDRGTLFNEDDDVVLERENNDTRRVAAHALVRAKAGPIRLSVMEAGLFMNEGVPGPISGPSSHVRYGVGRSLTVLRAEGVTGVTNWDAQVRGLVRQEDFDDRTGELGVGRRWTTDTSTSVGLHGHFESSPHAMVAIRGVARGRVDGWRSRDRLADEVGAPAHRYVGSLGLGTDVFGWGDRFRGSLEVRGIVVESASSVDAPVPGLEQAGRRVLVDGMPQGGIRVQPIPELTFTWSGGRSVRPPDLVELFGDRGAQVGRSDLRPERSWYFDGGLRTRFETTAGEVRSEVVGFYRWTRDLIAYTQNAQGVAVPGNIGAARVHGVEAGLAADLWQHLYLGGDLTWMRSADVTDPEGATWGNQLPGIPEWEIGARLQGYVRDRVRVGVGWSYTDGNYWDATNWYRSAPRSFVRVFGRLRLGRPPGNANGPGAPWLEIDVRNIANTITEDVPRNPLDRSDSSQVTRAVTDFGAYPLPGTTLLVTLSWRMTP